MKKFGLQIFSVRDHMADEQGVKEAFAKLGEMGYSYAHTAGTYDFIAPEKFYEYAKDAGIEICGTHFDWNRIINDVEGTVAYHKALGTNIVGIGGMPGPAREDEAELDKFIKIKKSEVRTKYNKIDAKKSSWLSATDIEATVHSVYRNDIAKLEAKAIELRREASYLKSMQKTWSDYLWVLRSLKDMSIAEMNGMKFTPDLRRGDELDLM
jgi:hypothetical protein